MCSSSRIRASVDFAHFSRGGRWFVPVLFLLLILHPLESVFGYGGRQRAAEANDMPILYVGGLEMTSQLHARDFINLVARASAPGMAENFGHWREVMLGDAQRAAPTLFVFFSVSSSLRPSCRILRSDPLQLAAA